jgi:hypothetical protein
MIRAAIQFMQAAVDPNPALQRWMVRYRGFVLIPQNDLTWLVRPERSPMSLLPFRTPASSVDDVKALIDWRLNQAA